MSRLPSYMPYESDVSDVSDESDMSDEEEDPRFALLRPPTATQTVTIDDSYGKWDEKTNIDSLENHVYLDPPKTTKTSLISIKSINRDRRVYPTPYRFQLKLPRVYKNITKFQLVQLSFPNSNSQNLSQAALITSTIVRNLLSSGVPSSCISDCISVIDCTGFTTTTSLVEQGRVTSSGEPLLISLSVPDGTYTDKQLAQEMTFHANRTPPFNLITYDVFRDIFMNTRDISVLFNEPGECFYSGITKKKMGHHTKNDMMSVYYTPQHLDLFPVITERIAFNAYYYPILKEVVATQRAQPFLQTDVIPYEEVVQRVMGVFEGLDSEFYYQLAQRNRGALDVYRRHLTFEYRNVNRYLCHYNEEEKQCTIVHDSLHPSLQRDLNGRYHYLMEKEVQLADLNIHSFTTLKQQIGRTSAIVKHLETNLSTVLGGYHFLSDYRYTGGDVHRGTGGEFTAAELDADEAFTTMFRYNSSIGGLYGNYQGTVMTFSTFADYHSSLSGYYEVLHSTQNGISTIHGKVYDEYHTYVSTKYSGVLPASVIEQRSYTVPSGLPVQFVSQRPAYFPGEAVTDALAQDYSAATCKQICCSTIRSLIGSWYSCLPTNFVIQTLQYRLGLVNIIPNQFNLLSTVANITSTGNLNLFMQINEEQGFNNMDIAMSENYMVSNETTGQVKLMCAKILMGAVGDSGISQTVIQNPSLFENTLGRLDKLDIKIYYDDPDITPAWLYQPYYLDVMEWNATFQVDEEIGFANRATGWGYKPTVPVPKSADATPYLFFTDKNNPNNS